MQGWAADALGVVAGVLSTASFVPQVIKALREGDTGAISLRMYAVTVTAFTLWTAFGFFTGQWVLIVFNLLSLGLSGTILVLKLRGSSRSAGAGTPARPAG